MLINLYLFDNPHVNSSVFSWTRSASSITSFVTGGVGGRVPFTEMQITPKYKQIELANANKK